jgi:HEAT repeat protein
MDVDRPNLPERELPERRLPAANLRVLHFVAVAVGVGLALLVSSAGGRGALWGKINGASSPQGHSRASSAALSERDLDLEAPQKQAEILLQRVVNRSDAPAEGDSQTEAQIEAHVDAWRGKLKWDSQLGDLTTVALNSSDERVRASAVEVQLAAYGLSKNGSSVDALARQANSSDHAQKIWALWTLGLLGNRGVETDRVVRVLTEHLKDSGKDSERGNEDARRWAVEGLALVGTTSTIAPLLEALHNDPSPMVRERAACNLAESGMLTHEQRLSAVPQLINYSGDPALDGQTHALAFQALARISGQSLANDSAAWRSWYETQGPGFRGQGSENQPVPDR